MRKFRNYLLIILLFLCSFSLMGAKRDVVTLYIEMDGEVISHEYQYGGERSFIEKIFGVDIQKRAEKLMDAGYSDGDIVRQIFPKMYIDIINLIDDTRVNAEDAEAQMIGDGIFRFSKEKLGYEIDSERLFEDIAHSLKNRRVVVSAKRKILYPKVNKSDLVENTQLMGEFTTKFSGSEERRHNILLASHAINRCEIKSDTEFSFNQVVGKRSAERGYMGATVIEYGKFVSGVGGGVCQVSTTLYNAVLLSDVAVTSVMHHSLPVKYVELSRDAMVSDYSDLRFYNNTGHSIFIFVKVEGCSLTVKLYGKKSRYDIVIESKKVEEIPREVEYVYDKSLKPDEEKVLVEGADGVKSEAYLLKYLGGTLISRSIIRQDSYAQEKKVVARGRRI